MFKRTSTKILGILAIAVAGMQAVHVTAQVPPPINWATASCDERKQAFTELAGRDAIYDLQWTYDNMQNDIFDPRCAFIGSLQPVGYATDPDILIDPNMQERIYFADDFGFFFVTYSEKNSISYVFRITIPIDPYEFIEQKHESLLQSVATGRAFHVPPPVNTAIDWPTAPCEPKMQAFEELNKTDAIHDLEWVYDGVKSHIFDPFCTFIGNLQPVGYATDPDILLDPNAQEEIYFASDYGFFLVTYAEKDSVSYVFRITEPIDPYVFIEEKREPLLQAVETGRAFHGIDPLPQAPEEVVAQAPVEVVVQDPENGNGEPLPPEEGNEEGQEDLLRQIEEIGALETNEPLKRMFYREGKITRSDEEEEEPPVQYVEEPEEDPLMQQLLKEQEEFLANQEEGEEGEEGEELVENEEEVVEEETPQEVAATSEGIGMTSIIYAGGAIVLGIVVTLFMLLKRKKKSFGGDAPPTAQTVAEGPQQKSERLEMALSEMDSEEDSAAS